MENIKKYLFVVALCGLFSFGRLQFFGAPIPKPFADAAGAAQGAAQGAAGAAAGAVGTLGAAALDGIANLPIPAAEVLQQFSDFRTKYAKNYAPGEEISKLQTFATNLVEILSPSAIGQTFKTAVNSLADYTAAEFKGLLGAVSLSPAEIQALDAEEDVGPGPTKSEGNSLDYENDPCLGPVEHQDTCGSCYAFSAVQVAAWHYCRATGKKYVNFSKQQIIDCSPKDKGCTSGWTKTASNYIAKNGIVAEQDYPYISNKTQCNDQKLKSAIFPITGTKKIEKTEEAMKQALSEHGPLLVLIDALKLAHYSSGIISGESCEHGQVNHAVVIVGLKSEGDKQYWRVKNHWGPDWGEKGFFNVEAFNPTNQGCLGIAGYPSHSYKTD